MKQKLAVFAQSGGPSPVVNRTLCRAFQNASYSGMYPIGAIHGIDGILNRKFYDLKNQPDWIVQKISLTPGMALGSKRKEPTGEECGRIVETFREMDVRYFFFIGGDNTARSTHLINRQAAVSGYEMTCIHIPKTIDNDILVTDHTPGFGSAGRFIALSLKGIELDNRALPGVHIVVTMGKDAGYLAAASSIAKNDENEAPHKIYVPEKEFSRDRFLQDVEAIYARLGRAVIVVAEGVWQKVGERKVSLIEFLNASHGEDGFGGMSLSGTGALGDYLAGMVKNVLKISRVRSETFGYSQRSFPGCISDVDSSEAALAGEYAVKYSLSGEGSGSVALLPLKDRGEKAAFLASLDEVGNGKKSMPLGYLTEEGCGVNGEFKAYASPLVGEMPSFASLRPIFYEIKKVK